MRSRTGRTLSSLLVLLLGSACFLDEPTRPRSAVPLDPLPPDPPLLAALPHASPLGATRLEVAPLSENSTVPWRPIAELSQPGGFRLDVRGTIDVTFNPLWWTTFCDEGGLYTLKYPALCSTQPYSFQGKTYGPAGAPDGSLRVAARLRRSDGSVSSLGIYLVQGDSTRVVSWSYGAGSVEVMRYGVDALDLYCGPLGNDPCVSIPRYAYHGFHDVKITSLGPLTIRARQNNVAIGDSIRFDLDANGAALGGAYVWWWVPGDTFPEPKGTNWTSSTRVERPCEGKPYCAVKPPFDLGGRMYLSAFTLDGLPWPGPIPVSEMVSVGKKRPTIALVEVKPPLPSASFTSLGGENEIRLTATISDPTRAAEVQWEVKDDPDDAVASGRPGQPAGGVASSFLVPSPPSPRSRWPGHPGELSQKALAYRVRAYVLDDGDTIWSESRTVRQEEVDVVRQEYIDFGKARVPAREEWGVHSTANFQSGELNSGDFSVSLAHPRMLTGIEQIRAEARKLFEKEGKAFPGLTVTSAFRNPVHQHVHLGDQKTLESSHFYGLATDVRIRDQSIRAEVLFKEYYDIAKRIRPIACYEPEDVVRRAGRGALTHSHFDWRSGGCHKDW